MFDPVICHLADDVVMLATPAGRLLRSTMATLRGRIGLIADVQYCDLEDGTDFSGVQVRRYRHSLEVLARAVEDWNSQGQVLLLAQLGDLVDGKAGAGVKDADSSEKALEAVTKVLAGCECKDVVNVVGNHELYNFSRERLGQLLDVSRGEKDGRTWFSFLPLEGYKLRIVVLDSYDNSTIESCKAEGTRRAVAYLREHNPNDVTSFGVDWSAGLDGLERRFMPYNGMMGEEQLAWLERSLEEAAGTGERVLVLGHVPLCPGVNRSDENIATSCI